MACIWPRRLLVAGGTLAAKLRGEISGAPEIPAISAGCSSMAGATVAAISAQPARNHRLAR
jgi:hypothetical protein